MDWDLAVSYAVLSLLCPVCGLHNPIHHDLQQASPSLVSSLCLVTVPTPDSHLHHLDTRLVLTGRYTLCNRDSYSTYETPVESSSFFSCRAQIRPPVPQYRSHSGFPPALSFSCPPHLLVDPVVAINTTLSFTHPSFSYRLYDDFLSLLPHVSFTV
jgi:hypothetical protein